MKPHYRLSDLAARYRVTTRSVQNMVDDGRLPAPTFYNGRFPIWDHDVIEANERAAASRPSKMLKAEGEAA